MEVKGLNTNYKDIHAQINYELTPIQKKASKQILNYVKNEKSVIVNAVCGAGKTELVYESIEYYLNKNLKVAFAIPRKEVVKEIYKRLHNDYPQIKCSCIYGGHVTNLNYPLIIITTHQLYRYQNYFDLIILDEADAFPYKDNELLEFFLNRSSKKTIIYLTATINENLKKLTSNIIYVHRRFHNIDIPIPKIILLPKILFTKYLKKKIIYYQKQAKPLLIFVATIDTGKKLAKLLNLDFVYAAKEKKSLLINKFMEKKGCLITTTILERGITIDNLQVIVYEANHQMFDKATLIQISGRVGRKKQHPHGDIIYLCNQISIEMNKSIQELKKQNQTNVWYV